MHSFRSSCGRLLEMMISLSNSPRSSLILAFEVLNVLSFFVVILSHTQSHPSVKCSVANSTKMPCTISSHSSKMSLDTFFSHNVHREKVVNIVLIFSCHEWITEHIRQFPGIRRHSRELVMSWCCVILSLL